MRWRSNQACTIPLSCCIDYIWPQDSISIKSSFLCTRSLGSLRNLEEWRLRDLKNLRVAAGKIELSKWTITLRCSRRWCNCSWQKRCLQIQLSNWSSQTEGKTAVWLVWHGECNSFHVKVRRNTRFNEHAHKRTYARNGTRVNHNYVIFFLRQESTESLSNYHMSPLRGSIGNLSVRSDSSSPMTFDSGYEYFTFLLWFFFVIIWNRKVKQ